MISAFKHDLFGKWSQQKTSATPMRFSTESLRKKSSQKKSTYHGYMRTTHFVWATILGMSITRGGHMDQTVLGPARAHSKDVHIKWRVDGAMGGEFSFCLHCFIFNPIPLTSKSIWCWLLTPCAFWVISIISDEKKKSLLLKTNHSQHNATGDRDDRNSKSHSKNETTAGDDASIEIYQHWRSSRQTLQDSLSRRNNLTIDVKDEVDFFYIYCVGYRLRSQQHAMETGNENLKSIKEMSNYQFAFIKRSDSTWTYAFLSRRLFQPRGVSNYNKQRLLEESEVVEEEAMEFVVEVYKSSRLEANAVDKIITKVIPESKYGSFIRCRSPDIFGRVTSEKDIVVGDNRERRGIYEWVASSTKSLFTARSA